MTGDGSEGRAWRRDFDDKSRKIMTEDNVSFPNTLCFGGEPGDVRKWVSK
ncbi:hypothetical protein HMPREF9374_2604 [Desmospora sp. 8437]|uniref:Uncharacterized protein n=1 Tax=Kroppenstedtia guangzhouensis TaxID=1274356 RepID=A0ABQ1H4A1_9BACL|nr:hypothetical protein HMPREF9374_2604 [Desmospora sp. 8437]GGA57288.1 hypothetical protein GCM10007416_33120 [Kroppenstedtia guangzhouensis]